MLNFSQKSQNNRFTASFKTIELVANVELRHFHVLFKPEINSAYNSPTRRLLHLVKFTKALADTVFYCSCMLVNGHHHIVITGLCQVTYVWKNRCCFNVIRYYKTQQLKSVLQNSFGSNKRRWHVSAVHAERSGCWDEEAAGRRREENNQWWTLVSGPARAKS